MSFLATTSGVSGEDVRDLMLAAVEHRFGLVNRLPVTIEWLSDNGSCYVAGETRSFARDIGSNRERRQSKVHRAMEWPKPSSVRSSVTTSTSVRARMHRPSCTSYQLGLITTTRFTPTRHSDIVHPVSSSQLTEARDRVRSFGGYNRDKVIVRPAPRLPERATKLEWITLLLVVFLVLAAIIWLWRM
jgi:transposase InsO family protein